MHKRDGMQTRRNSGQNSSHGRPKKYVLNDDDTEHDKWVAKRRRDQLEAAIAAADLVVVSLDRPRAGGAVDRLGQGDPGTSPGPVDCFGRWFSTPVAVFSRQAGCSFLRWWWAEYSSAGKEYDVCADAHAIASRARRSR